MKNIIKNLLKEWGIKLVLGEIVDILRDMSDAPSQRLANDIRKALDTYDRADAKLTKKTKQKRGIFSIFSK